MYLNSALAFDSLVWNFQGHLDKLDDLMLHIYFEFLQQQTVLHEEESESCPMRGRGSLLYRPLLRHWANLNRNLTAISISIKRWMGDIWCMWFSFGDFSYKFPASPGLIYLHLVIIWKDKQILLGEILVSLSLYTVIEPGWGKCAIIGEGRADRRTHREDICYTFNTEASLSVGDWGQTGGCFI